MIADGVSFLMKENYQFDYVCCIYAPNPFLKISDLKKGLKKIKSKKYNYVFSTVAYKFPFFRSFTFSSAKGLKMIFNKNVKKRSQDLKKIMCDAGQFYWAYKKTWIRKKSFFTKNSDVIMIPEWRYHDIDTKENWKRAEIYSKYIK